MISNKPNQEVLDEMMRVAESIFGTRNDPNQMPITMDSWNKLQKLNENCVLYEEENGKLISWGVVVPTTKDIVNDFLADKITERELLEKTLPDQNYSALYLCSAITIPEFRKQGHAKKLTLEAIARIPLTTDATLFAWPFTEDGKLALQKINSELNKKILIKT